MSPLMHKGSHALYMNNRKASMKPYLKYHFHIQEGKITHAIEKGMSNDGSHGSESCQYSCCKTFIVFRGYCRTTAF